MTCRCVVLAAATAFAVVIGTVSAVAATTPRLDPREVIARSEAAVGQRIGNYVLTDPAGTPLPLATLRGKPLVISLVYTSCSSVCPPATQHLIDAVREAGRVIGFDRFAVLTVGFDARNDTPARMAQFASFQGIELTNWRLASADAATITELLGDLGFSYVAVAGGFEHITQTTILDRDGKVYRQVYGEDFPLQVFIEPLKEVVFDTGTRLTLSGIIDRFKYICTTFDPGTRHYRFDYGIAVGGILGALSLALMGGIILREWRRAG